MPSVEYRPATPAFLASTLHARKVLVVEIAGLGDLVQSLPAMRAIRRAYPHAELHCLVRACNAELLQLTPWIDRAWPYRRDQHGAIGHHFDTAANLRAQGFDVAIDLSGSDYSSVVARISGASRRLVRKPGGGRRRSAWRWFATDVMQAPFGREPMYLQRSRCLRQAGLESHPSDLDFDISQQVADDPPTIRAPLRRSYLHVSPYARDAQKELSQSTMVQLLERLHRLLPQHELIVSCAGTARERKALTRLVAALPFAPAQVFSGTLTLRKLCGLIHGSALHLGADSGAMHLAWLLGAPSLSWFLRHRQIIQWAPQDAQHAAIAFDQRETASGIDAILAAALELIALAETDPLTAPPEAAASRDRASRWPLLPQETAAAQISQADAPVGDVDLDFGSGAGA